MKDRPANLVVQFKPMFPHLTSMEVCHKYGIKASTGSDHSTFIEHLMMMYYLENNIKFVMDVGWGYGSMRSYYWRQDHIEEVLKLLYLGTKKCKGRIELPATMVVWGDAQYERHLFNSDKAYVFQLKDTDQHNWHQWDGDVA